MYESWSAFVCVCMCCSIVLGSICDDDHLDVLFDMFDWAGGVFGLCTDVSIVWQSHRCVC